MKSSMGFAGLVVLLALPACVFAKDPRIDWADSLAGRGAVVKQDLPTLAPKQIGLLVVTPDRGTLFHYSGVTPNTRLIDRRSGKKPPPDRELYDRSPEQLFVKIKATQKAELSPFAWVMVPPDPIELTFIRPGATVTIAKVEVGATEVRILLWDEFSQRRRKDPASTSFSILWPTRLSRDFRECEEIEELIGQVLDLRAP